MPFYFQYTLLTKEKKQILDKFSNLEDIRKDIDVYKCIASEVCFTLCYNNDVVYKHYEPLVNLQYIPRHFYNFY